MKKAQSEIITTVLLVLIALAAVAIIAVFITNQVRQGAATADAKAQCIKIDLEVTKAVNAGTTITVKNNGDAPTGAKMLAIVDGTTWGSETDLPSTLETETIVKDTSDALATDSKIEIGVRLVDGTACPAKTVYTVTLA